MPAEYLPILIFLAVAGGLGLLLLALGFVFGPRRPDPQKLSPYECGFEAFEDSRDREHAYRRVIEIADAWKAKVTTIIPAPDTRTDQEVLGE